MLNKFITDLHKKLAILEDSLNTQKQESKRIKDSLVCLKSNKDLYKQSLDMLKQLDIKLRNTITTNVESIVTRLYQYVFQNDDTFVIKYEEKRGVVSANFYIQTTKDGQTILVDPIEEEGGGKVDVVALGLRIAGLILYTPKLDKILIFDEPLKYLSSGSSSSLYKKRAAEFLKLISTEYGIQIIMVTHDSEFVEVADKKFKIALDSEGFSKVEEC